MGCNRKEGVKKDSRVFHLSKGNHTDGINWNEEGCGSGRFSDKLSKPWFANVTSEMSIRHQMEMSGIFFHFTRF